MRKNYNSKFHAHMGQAGMISLMKKRAMIIHMILLDGQNKEILKQY